MICRFYFWEEELQSVAILYMTTEFVGIFLDLKNTWFTLGHRVVACLACYEVLKGFQLEGLPKGRRFCLCFQCIFFLGLLLFT